MSHSFKRRAQALCIGVAAVSIGASGLLIATSGAASAGSRATVPPLDHFICYTASGQGFKVNPNLLLKNAIQPALFAPKVVSISTHCNPANKSVPVAVFPAKNPLAHLLCWSIAFQYKPVKVLLTNQFGKSVMTTGPSPSRLCLPSWKSNVAPPNMTPTAPPRLDHFTCYPLVAAASSYGFRPPAPLKVEDEFSAPKYTPIKVGVANLLCVPTTKLVAGIAYSPMTPGDKSLVCFPSSPTPYWKVVFDENQFGQGPVFPTPRLEQLCVPSTLSVQSPVG